MFKERADGQTKVLPTDIDHIYADIGRTYTNTDVRVTNSNGSLECNQSK